MLHKFVGFILIIDAVSSLFLPLDKHWLWQVGRTIRIFIGVYLLFS